MSNKRRHKHVKLLKITKYEAEMIEDRILQTI